MGFEPHCLATAVGSFPHKSAEDALDLILAHFPEIPVWPQLPALGFRENMYIQFSEGFPGLTIDEARGRIQFDTAGDIYASLEPFLEKVVSERVEDFAISRTFAGGLHAFCDRLRARKPEGLSWIKGQITGPISFGLTITDGAKRAILYHPEIYEAVLKGLVLRARWQVRALKGLHARVLLFIDEPYLSAFGSAFINLSREQVVRDLTEVIDGIHREGALAGVHCCGNTDWTLLTETAVDLVNFDAHEYFQGLALYPEALSAFLERGGVLAWGIVPASEEAERATVDSLAARFEAGVDDLVARGLSRDRLLRQSLVTPSCGMGARTPALAETIVRATGGLSHRLREAHSLV